MDSEQSDSSARARSSPLTLRQRERSSACVEQPLRSTTEQTFYGQNHTTCDRVYGKGEAGRCPSNHKPDEIEAAEDEGPKPKVHDKRQQTPQLNDTELHFFQLCAAAAHELKKKANRDHCAEAVFLLACKALNLRTRAQATGAMEQLQRCLPQNPDLYVAVDDDERVKYRRRSGQEEIGVKEPSVIRKDFAVFDEGAMSIPVWKGNVRALLIRAEELLGGIDGSRVVELRGLREAIV